MSPFPIAIFLSAFLLFQLQPIIARYILPWYGGSPGVWTACMMFFQVALLCGYLYAHLLTYLPAKRQVFLHLTLLTLSLLMLPVDPQDSWLATVDAQPTVQILAILTITVGVPFVLISASAPLLQHWFSNVQPDKSPFRLYALSNLGSLLALLSYPTIFEPRFTMDVQAVTWSFLYIVLAISCAWCGIAFFKSDAIRDIGARRAEGLLQTISTLDRILWVALAATGSTALLAITNKICQDVAVVPLLWILPLGLYLISFIISFHKDAWYKRGIWIPILFASLVPLLHLMFGEFTDAYNPLAYEVGVYSLALFACCMVCHGELARRKSAVPQLTTFYLYVALGGAIGGIFVNLIAPILFSGFWELHVALVATIVLAGICIGTDKRAFGTPRRRTAFASGWSVGVAALALALVIQVMTGREDSIYSDRGFFGVMFVYEWNADTINHERGLYHGRIQHGRQLMHKFRARWASSYYGVSSGVAAAIRGHPRRRAADSGSRGLNIGAVGLGVGTISTYGTQLDSIRFYEINPQIEEIARNYFSYLRDSKAEVEVILGDARLSMEREFLESGSNKFDVLVLDAFSGDAIPVHLLTVEAFDLYAKHLRDDGILAIHITNQWLDLRQVVRGASKRLGMKAIWIEDNPKRSHEDSSDWVLVTRNPGFARSELVRSLQTRWHDTEPRPTMWTDDFSNLFQVVNWD